jgi:membrane-associated phospholipid phosphatase
VSFIREHYLTCSLQDGFGPAVWGWVSRLGQAEVMLPCVAALAMWMIWARAGREAGTWLGSLGAAAGLTLATKVAFIGWGVGIASLDFTGISGHAMLSAATWPVMLSVLAARFCPGWQRGAVVAGFGLAALVAYSRVVLGAHSPSEAVAGFLLGAMASGVVLGRFQTSHALIPAWLSISLALWLVAVPAQAPPAHMQGLITRLALQLSNHPLPFTRAHLHKQL